jgi:biopolymer transport protein TolQ
VDPTVVDPSGVITEKNLISMLFGSGPVVQGVLILLIVLSVMSWAITISKFLQLRRARQDSDEFTRIFWESKNLSRVDDSSRRLESSPLAGLFIIGYREVLRLVQGKESVLSGGDSDMNTIESALGRAEIQEMFKLEKGIVFLATVASSAPFIGLFGTVWGIMNAFHGLSAAKSSTIQAVAPGISEALVATAVGLAAAIPAAIAYNYFSAAIKQFRQSMFAFKHEFMNVARISIAK